MEHVQIYAVKKRREMFPTYPVNHEQGRNWSSYVRALKRLKIKKYEKLADDLSRM